MTDDRAQDEREIRTLIEHWTAAVRRKDYDAILERHAPDILMFDVPPPLDSRGIEAYRKTWDLFFRWSDTPVVSEITEMHVTAGAGVAFAAALLGNGDLRRGRTAAVPAHDRSAQDRRPVDDHARAPFRPRH